MQRSPTNLTVSVGPEEVNCYLGGGWEEFYMVSYPPLCTQRVETRCYAALVPPHCLACSSQQMFAEPKSIKNDLGKHFATFFSPLWNCSLPECSRTASLHCNPSLWGKNQLHHIRAGFSWDELPGTRPDRPLCRSSSFSTPPYPPQTVWADPGPSHRWKGRIPSHHPQTGPGSPGKAYTSWRFTIYATFHSTESIDLIQQPRWVEQLVQSHFRYLEKFVLKSNTFILMVSKPKKYKQLILSTIPSSY